MKTVKELLDEIVRAVDEMADVAYEAARLAKPSERGSAGILLNILDNVLRRVDASIARLRVLHEDLVSIVKPRTCKDVKNPFEHVLRLLDVIDATIQNIESDVGDAYRITRDIVAKMPRFSRFSKRRELLKKLDKARIKAEEAIAACRIGIATLALLLSLACGLAQTMSER